MIKITGVTMQFAGMTLVRHQAIGGADWVSLYADPVNDQEDPELIWDGHLTTWLEIRLMFNELHRMITLHDVPRQKAFPAHQEIFDLDGEDWP